MNRLLHHAAFALGLLAIAWVAAGYIPGNLLALALLLPIAAGYLVGAVELLRFQRDTAGLGQVLADCAETPATLDGWVTGLPPALRNAVRLRVQGDRVPLPGPALTPYLVGLLVLLGMLGTFLGMVATLKGTGLALENASDVEAIRASLAAPVKGLGLAFGSSVAGVAASAMLGLMSALARRDRQRCTQQLDGLMAGTLRPFSHAHQREESLRLQRVQAEAMPALVQQLQGLATQLATQGQSLHDRMLDSQAQFQGHTQRAYQDLAQSVDQSLKTSLADSARLAGAAIEPAVQGTLAGLARESATLRETLSSAVQQQLDGISLRLDAQAHALAARWQAALDGALQGIDQRSALQLQHTRDAVTATVAGFEQQATALLKGVALAQDQQVRASGDVIAQLRAALSASLDRDNAALDERNRLLGTLGQLLDAVNHASTQQRSAIDALVQASADMLHRAGQHFAGSVDAGTATLQQLSAQVTGSAADMASLGEGFGAAVQLFSRASEQLLAQLQHIETALGQSMARSDEQLAYYVAQAREIVDLTLGSHKQIVDDLQQLARVPAPPAAEATAA